MKPLFTGINVPDEYDNDQIAFLGGMKITVEAHAIQADGFIAEGNKTAEDVAWEAFDGQNN